MDVDPARDAEYSSSVRLTWLWVPLLGGAAAGCGALIGLDGDRPCASSECAEPGGDAGADAGGDEAPVAADAGPEASACGDISNQRVCTTVPQSGCNADQTCDVFDPKGDTACFNAGTYPLWSSCTAHGQCGHGASCTTAGVCKPLCCTSDDCQGRPCVPVGAGPTVLIPAFNVCAAGCDLINPQTVCGSGATCEPYPWDGKDKDVGDCFGPAGAGMGPNACNGTPSGPLQCAPGYYCTPDKYCRKWCRIGVAQDCPGATVCTGFSGNQAVIGGVAYGLCV